MKKAIYSMLLSAFLFSPISAQEKPQGGADEKTPSRSLFFSWINNTNEGATARQTQINLDFFKWLHDKYGMQLDIYAFDAGAIDGAKIYGSTRSKRFKQQFPEGFAPLSRQASAMGTRLGVWGGPDGFGDTDEEARERMDMMIELVEKHNFALFKMDAVCGQLRPEKYDYFNSMMTRIRELSPDFILLNHRLNLGPGTKHSTTFLLGGAETYIDVHMTNSMTAPHHRAQAISRKAPDNLTRLTEDHGVCLSSCLDYWEDDLILQAFGRELILSPEIYANPWLLRDDEYPMLAFIFNLHRTYRDILPSAMRLPAEQYGAEALSRGDEKTRFITLRNLSWNPVVYKINLDASTGLKKSRKQVQVRQYHPFVYDLGTHEYGSVIEVTVAPFRASLVKITTAPEKDKIALSGVPYQIINDKAGNGCEVKLLGMPGETYNVKLGACKGSFRSAMLDGASVKALLAGETVAVSFPGEKLQKYYHRHISAMGKCDVPRDASSLYYATLYAADNNALEVRSLKRSGTTSVPQVQAARDAFFGQDIFRERDIWDKNLFDGDEKTCFSVCSRFGDRRKESSSGFFIDLGAVTNIDSLVISVPDEFSLTPLKSSEGVSLMYSCDLKEWGSVSSFLGKETLFDLGKAGGVRYLRLSTTPVRVNEVRAFEGGKELARDKWCASNLFRTYGQADARATAAWSSKFVLDEIPRGAYLCVAVNGKCGEEGAWAAFKVDGEYVGCPDRAPSFISNTWEYRVAPTSGNYTYYLPLTPEMKGKEIEAWVLKLGKDGSSDIKPEVWLSTYPIPFESKNLILE